MQRDSSIGIGIEEARAVRDAMNVPVLVRGHHGTMVSRCSSPE